MSDQTEEKSCRAIRERAFDYRRGDLSDEQREVFVAHLERCEACRDFADRLDIVIGAAREYDYDVDAEKADAMFDEIAGRIGESGSEESRSEKSRSEESRSEEDEIPTVGRPWGMYVGVAAAAAVGLIVGAVVLGVWRTEPGSERGAVADEQAAGGEEERAADEGFAGLQPATEAPAPVDGSTGESVPDNVRVFASTSADWRLSGEETLTLDIDRGRMLVEFIPRGGQTLRVDAPGYSVEVVGTVFYVSAGESDETLAGVVEGEVEVERDSGPAVRLTSRQEVTGTFERREMTERRRRQLESYVDLEAHRRALAEVSAEEPRAASAEEPSGLKKKGIGSAKGRGPTGTPSDEPSEGRGLARLRRRADRAVGQGYYGRAERQYLSFLERAPAGHDAVGPVHLDLASLYIKRLDRPAKAVPHLKTFVERWPEDVAASSARRTLCDLTRQLEQYEPECGARNAERGTPSTER
jgi:ferric-dicitrate binding protein FerR (iron transport regulator)